MAARKIERAEPSLGSPTVKKEKTNKTVKNNKQAKKPSWESVVRKDYPQFAYLLDNPDLFGADLVATMKNAVRLGWSPDRFRGAISNTNYWKTTTSSAKRFDAATPADQQALIDETSAELNQISEFGELDQAQVGVFTRDMARRGIKGDNLKKFAYSFIFKQGVDTEAAKQAMESEQATLIKKVAKAYGTSLNDDDVRSYLEQGKTGAEVARMYKEKLKGQYPHLAGQLDADLTFDDITADYKRAAASILERTDQDIDFTKPEFMEAIATRDDKGNTRQLSMGEWVSKLKSDSRYGYSKTKTAIRDAQNLASSIARSFGKVM